MSDPTTREMHSDIVTRLEQGFEHDKRLRAVEQDVAALRLLPNEVQRLEQRLTADASAMEKRIVAEIQGVKPKPVWPAIAALVPAIAMLFGLAAVIYQR